MTRPDLPLAPAAATLAALADRLADGMLPARIGPVHVDVGGHTAQVWLADLRHDHTRDGPCQVGRFDVVVSADGVHARPTVLVEVNTHGQVLSTHPDPIGRQVARLAADALYGADSDEALEQLVAAGWTWVMLHDVVRQLSDHPGPGMTALLSLLPGCRTEAALVDGWDGTVADLIATGGALEDGAR